MVSLAAVGILFAWSLAELLPAFSAMRTLMARTAFSAESLRVLIKCLGVCYLCEIAGQICKEAGQTAIAAKIEMAGKAAVLLLSLPMFEELLSIALDLIHL